MSRVGKSLVRMAKGFLDFVILTKFRNIVVFETGFV